MKYTGEQLAALTKMGIAMTLADGKVTEEEKLAVSMELVSFGVQQLDGVIILSNAESMDYGVALAILSSMSDEQKKYATGYLATIMAIDGDVDDSEVKLWQLICTLGGFPIMNISEALSFWASHK